MSATTDYIDRVAAGASPEAERRVMSHRERLEDALFTGLRLTAGVDVERASRQYGIDAWDRYGDRLRRFLTGGCYFVRGRSFGSAEMACSWQTKLCRFSSEWNPEAGSW